MKLLRALTLLMGLLGLLAALGVRARPDGMLHVYFLATPGDAVLIAAPDGGFVLIDGGGDPALLALELGRRLPFWRRSLDAVVLTRADAGRVAGQVAALARYRSALALAPAALGRGAQIARWRVLLADQHTPLIAAQPGRGLRLGGLRLTVVDSTHDDGAGLVLRAEYGATALLLAPSLQERQEHALLASGAATPVTLAYLPWSRAVGAGLLAGLRPRTIVYADGYRSEEPALLSYRERASGGAMLFHEQLDGTVELVSDGRRAWVVAEDGF